MKRVSRRCHQFQVWVVMSECLVFHDEGNDADIWDLSFVDMSECVVMSCFVFHDGLTDNSHLSARFHAIQSLFLHETANFAKLFSEVVLTSELGTCRVLKPLYLAIILASTTLNPNRMGRNTCRYNQAFEKRRPTGKVA